MTTTKLSGSVTLDTTGNTYGTTYQNKRVLQDASISPTKVVLTYREYTSIMYACYPPRKAPDYIQEETYEVVDGELKLTSTRTGRILERPATEEVEWIFNTLEVK